MLNVADVAPAFRKAAAFFEAFPEAWGRDRFCKDKNEATVALETYQRVDPVTLAKGGCTFCGIGAAMAFDDLGMIRDLGPHTTDLTIWLEDQFEKLNGEFRTFYHFNDDERTTVGEVITMLRLLADKAEQQ